MKRQRTPRLSLDLLRGFHAAARHLSFTRAAHELFVTQSAISHEIRTLEEQLGRPLFRRVNRSLQLTQTGEELYRAIDEALTLIDVATERASGPWRTLSVTTTVALASTWLVPRLPRFAALNPEVDLRIVASNDTVDLKREHIDVAIRFVLMSAPQPALEKPFDYRQFPCLLAGAGAQSRAAAAHACRPRRSCAGRLRNHPVRPWVVRLATVVQRYAAARDQGHRLAPVLAL